MSSKLSAVQVYKEYFPADKQAVKSIQADLKLKGIDCNLTDIIKAVEPKMETPAMLVAV